MGGVGLGLPSLGASSPKSTRLSDIAYYVDRYRCRWMQVDRLGYHTQERIILLQADHRVVEISDRQTLQGDKGEKCTTNHAHINISESEFLLMIMK